MKKIFMLLAVTMMAGGVKAEDIEWTNESTSAETDSWTNTIYYSTTTAENGGALKVTLTANTEAQVQVSVSNPWGNLDSGACQDVTSGDYYFVFNSTEAANINISKLAIQGKNITITAIQLLSPSEVAALAPTNVDLGITGTNSNWSGVNVPNTAGGDALKTVKVGDVIKATLSPASEGSYQIQEGVYYRALVSGNLSTSTTELSITVTEANMGVIRMNGITFKSGQNFTVSAVNLIKSPIGYTSSAKYLYGTVWDNDKDSYEDNKEVSKVVVNKALVAGKNTIVLPFETTAEAIAGTGAVAYEFTEATASTLTFTRVSTMEANKPYLLNAPSAQTEISVSSVTLKSKAAQTVTPTTGYSMIGNYVHDFSMDDKWGINNGGNIQKGGEGAKLPAFSAYFENIPVGASVKAILIDTETGITSVERLQVADGTYYNLSGQRVSHPQHGIYVVNGKKVMIP